MILKQNLHAKFCYCGHDRHSFYVSVLCVVFKGQVGDVGGDVS